MSKFSLHNQLVEIPLQGMEFIRFFTCGGCGAYYIVNLFMPPLNNNDLTPFPVRGIYCLQFNFE